MFEKKHMKVYAFVGPSGTGKSYRAQMVANEKGIDLIIDDGLLIQGNKVLAGTSAKKAPTKIETVRNALFQSEEKKKEIMYKINNEHSYPQIEFDFTSTIDFKKLSREFIKIAYETAYYILGEKYLEDVIGQDLRESLFNESHELIEKYAERGMQLMPQPKPKEIFNELTKISDKNLIHFIEISEVNNKLYVAINLFNIYKNCICITETVDLYDFNDVIHFILFYHENNEKTFIELNELDLAKMMGNIPQK